MAAVRDVPNMARQKVAVSARHRGSLKADFRREKVAGKPLKHAFYAIFSCPFKLFRPGIRIGEGERLNLEPYGYDRLSVEKAGFKV